MLGKQQRCLDLFHSPLQKTLTQLDDSNLDERINAFGMPTKRTMSLKRMPMPVLSHNPLTRAKATTHPIRHFIAHLNELLLTGASLFNKISYLVLVKEKDFSPAAKARIFCRRKIRAIPLTKLRRRVRSVITDGKSRIS